MTRYYEEAAHRWKTLKDLQFNRLFYQLSRNLQPDLCCSTVWPFILNADKYGEVKCSIFTITENSNM